MSPNQFLIVMLLALLALAYFAIHNPNTLNPRARRKARARVRRISYTGHRREKDVLSGYITSWLKGVYSFDRRIEATPANILEFSYRLLEITRCTHSDYAVRRIVAAIQRQDFTAEIKFEIYMELLRYLALPGPIHTAHRRTLLSYGPLETLFEDGSQAPQVMGTELSFFSTDYTEGEHHVQTNE